MAHYEDIKTAAEFKPLDREMSAERRRPAHALAPCCQVLQPESCRGHLKHLDGAVRVPGSESVGTRCPCRRSLFTLAFLTWRNKTTAVAGRHDELAELPPWVRKQNRPFIETHSAGWGVPALPRTTAAHWGLRSRVLYSEPRGWGPEPGARRLGALQPELRPALWTGWQRGRSLLCTRCSR